MRSARDIAALVVRSATAALFLWGATARFHDPRAVAEGLTAAGVPGAPVVAALSAAFESTAALALLLGFGVRPVAAVLAVWTSLAFLFVPQIWAPLAIPALGSPPPSVVFAAALALLVATVALGSGRPALDAWLRRAAADAAEPVV